MASQPLRYLVIFSKKYAKETIFTRHIPRENKPNVSIKIYKPLKANYGWEIAICAH